MEKEIRKMRRPNGNGSLYFSNNYYYKLFIFSSYKLVVYSNYFIRYLYYSAYSALLFYYNILFYNSD